MPSYATDFITQTIVRADFVTGTVPLTQLPPAVLNAAADLPQRSSINRTKNEVTIRRTPQGTSKDTHTVNFLEHNFFSEDKNRHAAVCSEHIYVADRRYEGFDSLRDTFLDLLDAAAQACPTMKLKRLGLRYINEIRLPEEDAGPGLGADFWQQYINPLLLGGLRFAANDGAMARHMCTTELNYGIDRATIRYGIFNNEYPKPNRKREFILDIDTYCQLNIAPADAAQKLREYHTAALSVFEAAVTDKLRERMNRRDIS